MEGGLNRKKVCSSETSGFKGKNFLLSTNIFISVSEFLLNVTLKLTRSLTEQESRTLFVVTHSYSSIFRLEVANNSSIQ